MSDYIKREDARTLLFDRLIETANNNTGYQCDSGVVYQDAAERLRLCWLNEVPAADVVERKRGKWQPLNSLTNKCTSCGEKYWFYLGVPFNFCPSCGAKMRGDSDV